MTWSTSRCRPAAPCGQHYGQGGSPLARWSVPRYPVADELADVEADALDRTLDAAGYARGGNAGGP